MQLRICIRKYSNLFYPFSYPCAASATDRQDTFFRCPTYLHAARNKSHKFFYTPHIIENAAKAIKDVLTNINMSGKIEQQNS